ncbi:MAG: hypothetical protein JW772_02525 [Candidatus Diapherotrites archaeon]|nr:hypothetical protein [Candidatus Diapherotrites archaeon]
MVQEKGMQHFQMRKRIHEKHEPYPHPQKSKRAIDKLIYIAVAAAPIANIPQLLKIWLEKDASGVSIISWISFSIISIVWLVYGIAHKEKPIIAMNCALIVMQILIVIGVLTYG